jgi:hypothetical protein
MGLRRHGLQQRRSWLIDYSLFVSKTPKLFPLKLHLSFIFDSGAAVLLLFGYKIGQQMVSEFVKLLRRSSAIAGSVADFAAGS